MKNLSTVAMIIITFLLTCSSSFAIILDAPENRDGKWQIGLNYGYRPRESLGSWQKTSPSYGITIGHGSTILQIRRPSLNSSFADTTEYVFGFNWAEKDDAEKFLTTGFQLGWHFTSYDGTGTTGTLFYSFLSFLAGKHIGNWFPFVGIGVDSIIPIPIAPFLLEVNIGTQYAFTPNFMARIETSYYSYFYNVSTSNYTNTITGQVSYLF